MGKDNSGIKVLVGIGSIIVLLVLGFRITGFSIFGVNLERESIEDTPRPQPTHTPDITAAISSPTATSPPRPTYPTSIAGVWEGTYRCLYEGEANVVLEISGNERIDAEFYFSPNRENPSHPSGAFNMTGTYDSKEGIVKLDATTWIDEPAPENPMGNVNALASSVRMDMVATVAESGARIEGRLDPVSGIDVCNRIEVARAN